MSPETAARSIRRPLGVVAIVAIGTLLLILAWPMFRVAIFGPCSCTQSPSPTSTPLVISRGRPLTIWLHSAP